jgi:hypothetical protein
MNVYVESNFILEQRELLDAFGCKFFARFDDGLHYVEARLRKEGP